MKYITSLTSAEAKQFFLKQESYCNFDLPEYFVFDQLLAAIDTYVGDRNLSDFRLQIARPDDLEGVNHKLISNKDGKYAWRPFQLIHPALYVELVNVISKRANWTYLTNWFADCRRHSGSITCASIPVVSTRFKRTKSEQITTWSNQVEKVAIATALEFDYVHYTDISDCYGSLYTHTVPWALHTMPVAKLKKKNNNLLGNKIDSLLRSMSNGQTNGIPQGSTLMDLVAEIVLSYVDVLLAEQIAKKKIKKNCYKIIRYRDDYRIFTNNPQDGDVIVKELTDVLHVMGMKISPTKTSVSTDIIHSSVKPDKLDTLVSPKTFDSYTSELYSASLFSLNYPNSGQLQVKLNEFYERIVGLGRKDIKENLLVLSAIIADIACRNPRTYPIAAAILSKLLFCLPKSEMKRTVKKLGKKFDKVPHTNILQLWLQRIKVDFSVSPEHTEALCDLVLNNPATIWNSDWLNASMQRIISQTSIVDREKLYVLPHVISLSEVELFVKSYDE